MNLQCAYMFIHIHVFPNLCKAMLETFIWNGFLNKALRQHIVVPLYMHKFVGKVYL